MTTYKPLLARPVEIVTGTNDTIKIRSPSGSGGYTSITIGAGVYASIYAVIWEFYAQINLSGPISINAFTMEDGGDTDGKYTYIKIVANASSDILIDQEATGRMLGWGRSTSTTVTGTTFNFNHQPEYIWIPRFQVANQERFYRTLGDEFAGKKTKTGLLAGNPTGPVLQYRNLEFQNEKAFNVFEEGADGELYSDRSDITKNLQYFVKQSMSVSPSVAGNPSNRCFWYIPDWNNALGDVTARNVGPGADNSYTDDAGIRFDLSSNPDLWAFCQFEETAIEPPVDVGVPTGRQLYNQASMMIHTVSDQPTFATTNSDTPT
jgi:hypothetical protein